MKSLVEELDTLIAEDEDWDVFYYTSAHNQLWDYWKGLPKSSKFLDTYTAKDLGKQKALSVVLNDLRFIETIMGRLEKAKQTLIWTKAKLEKK